MNRLFVKFFISFGIFLFASSNASAASQADKVIKADELPVPILEMIQTSARQGTCETRWQDIADEIGIIESHVDDAMTLFLVPCAQWSANLAWTAFVTLDEATHGDGFLTLALRFVAYTPYEGLVAKDVVHNLVWDGERKRLTTRYYLNDHEQCGTAAQYEWSSAQRNLLLQTLIKQDVCEGQPAPWTPLYQAQLGAPDGSQKVAF